MNRQEFINLLEAPELVSQQTANALSDLVNAFPYCQLSQMLYAKNLYSTHSIHYDKQLKTAAAYAPDRKKLYYLINPVSSVLTTEDENPEVEVFTHEINEVIAIREEKTIAIKPVVVEVTTPIVETKPEPLQPKQESVKPVDPIINKEPVKQPVQVVSEQHTKEDLQAILKQRLAEINSKKPTENLPVSTTNKISEPAVKPEEPVAIPESIKPIENIVVEEAKPIPEQKAVSDTLRSVDDRAKIINKFIEEQPRISRQKAEFFNPSNLANKSIDDQGGIVSETLAQIYSQQGKIGKAIDTYERLSLIFPEKRSYFADLITKLREQNSDDKA